MSSSPGIDVRLLRDDEEMQLPGAMVQQAGFVGLDSWTGFIRSVYGLTVHRLAARTAEDEVAGWLALVHIRHPIFGSYLATSPFGSYGGFARSSAAVGDALLDKARDLGSKLAVDYVNVRFDPGDETPPDGWIQHPIYATYQLELSPDLERLMRAYGSDHRNHIRKSMRKGFSIRFGHLELLDGAYEGLARSMHELGSPYHAKSYLRAMAEWLGSSLEFAVLFDPRGVVAGAGVFILHDGVVTNLHANILRRFRRDYAGEYLYWSAIERYGRAGCTVFDLGRSLIGSGNEAFKMKWKPQRRMLAYWYALLRADAPPALNQKNPKFQLAIRLWQRMPAFLVRALGPGLIRGLA